MKKSIKFMMVLAILVAMLAVTACVRENGGGTQQRGEGEDAVTRVERQTVAMSEIQSLHGLDANLRFIEPVTISVGLWDRGNERQPDFAQSYWAEWVAANVLEDHNIIVNWITIPRWGEGEFLSTLLGANDAPDISYTFGFDTVETFAGMGGILDMAPLLSRYHEMLPNLYGLLTYENMYFNINPNTGELWGLAGRHLDIVHRLNTFVRTDWLETLNIQPPTTLQQFEDMLIAFRDNAELLLGPDANRMVPFLLGHDVGWTGDPILTSFIPNDITERDFFIHGFDDRRFMMPGIKEGVRVLNRWYNNNLLWDDFFLHPPGDPMADDMKRLGFVGAFVHNWDVPFRAAEAIITTMQENVGSHANYMVVTPFPNDAGNIRLQVPNPTDRTIFFPHTNTQPIASLLYLDWISRHDVREFLQFGLEGVHRYTHPDGAIQVLGERPDDHEDGPHTWPDHQFIPSLRNFDILITVNGIDLGDDERTARTIALAYPGIAPEQIMAARYPGYNHSWSARRVAVRPIAAQEGMNEPLRDFRDTILHNVIANTSEANFDATWNAMFQDYLNMGGQAILDERRAAWIEEFGDVDRMP